MFRNSSFAGCIALSSMAAAADASTFALDMWVYEFEAKLVKIEENSPVFAYASVPTGTLIPEGCTTRFADYSPDDDPDSSISIDCIADTPALAAENLGIDVLGAVSPTILTGAVGFNDTSFVCLLEPSDVLPPWCPGSNDLIENLAVDYANGSASFDFSSNGMGFGSLSLGDGGGHTSIVLPLSPSGAWDYGINSGWYTLPDNLVFYEGTAALVQAPNVVPLPASAWMLAMGVFGLVVAGRRRIVS